VAASFWQSVWWTYFASLPEDRLCYRLIKKHHVTSILEICLEDGVRGDRMIQMALRGSGARVVNYVGIDLFEANPDPEAEPLTLKQAHQQFSALGARVKLIPGEPFAALNRIANSLKDIELVVIGCDADPEQIARCWALMPRFLADQALVLLQADESQDFKFQVLSVADVKQRADGAKPKSKSKLKRVA